MLKAISKESAVIQALPNHKKCIVHYLDNTNVHLAIEYLKSAREAGAIGHEHLYCLSSTRQNLVDLLNYTDIVDFQRLIIIVPVTVSIL